MILRILAIFLLCIGVADAQPISGGVASGIASGTPLSAGSVTASGSTTARTLAQRDAGCDANGSNCSIIHAKDFGLSVSNTGAQNTTALQAIATRACALAPVIVDVEPGIFAVDATSSIPFDEGSCNFISFHGAGVNNTYFSVSGTNDFIHVGGTTASYWQPGFLADFSAQEATANTASGAGIHLDSIQRMNVRNVFVSGFFTNLHVASALNMHFINVVSGGDNTTAGSALWLFDKATSGLSSSEIYVTDTNSRAQTLGTYTYGAIITQSDGISFDNFHLGFTSGAAIHLAPVGTTDRIIGVSLSNGLLDEAGTGIDCVQPGGYTGNIGNIYMAASGVNAATNAGLTFSCAALSNVTVNGLQIGGSGSSAISITAGSNFSFNGGVLVSNNALNNGSPNIYVGGTSTHTVVDGMVLSAGTTALPNQITVADTADYVNIGANNNYGGGGGANNVVVTSTGKHNPPLTGYQYNGPGDINNSASAFWGLRGYSVGSAIAGTKAVNIVRASDSTTADIIILPTGKLDVATATTFCAATTCKVVTLYDQTGNGWNITQGTDAARPAFTLNCLNSMPCMTFAGSQWLQDATAPTISNPYTIIDVAQRTGALSSYKMVFSSGVNDQVRFGAAANLWSIYAGGAAAVSTAATDSAWHIGWNLIFSGSSSISVDNTTPVVGNAGPNGIATNLTMGAHSDGTNGITGTMTEMGIWPSNIGAAAAANQCHNAYTFWATSVAC